MAVVDDGGGVVVETGDGKVGGDVSLERDVG